MIRRKHGEDELGIDRIEAGKLWMKLLTGSTVIGPVPKNVTALCGRKCEIGGVIQTAEVCVRPTAWLENGHADLPSFVPVYPGQQGLKQVKEGNFLAPSFVKVLDLKN